MIKKFLGVTALAAATLLAANPALAHNDMHKIANTAEAKTFFQNFENEFLEKKPVTLNNKISHEAESSRYTFQTSNKITVEESLLKHKNISEGHKEFTREVAKSYNEAYSKGYYKIPVTVNVYLSNENSYKFYSTPEVLAKYQEYKDIDSFNKQINADIDQIQAEISDHFNGKTFNFKDPFYLKKSQEEQAKRNQLKDYPSDMSEETFLNIQSSSSQFDTQKNTSNIFVLGNKKVDSEHINLMTSKSDAHSGTEQCSTIVTSDANGSQVNLMMGADLSTKMFYDSVDGKKLFNKFVLLHELSHCTFGVNSTTKFDKIKTGNADVDKSLNEMFNPANKNRYSNVFVRHLQEHYADTYAAMVLLREEGNQQAVKSMLSDFKKVRSTNTLSGDFEHFTSYSLQQLEHPEIIKKIQSLPIEQLPALAMEISQKGTALTLANSKDFQKYLSTSGSKAFFLTNYNSLIQAVYDGTIEDVSYHSKGLGNKDSYSSQFAEKTFNHFQELFKNNPELKQEMKIALSIGLDDRILQLNMPKTVKDYKMSKDATAIISYLFSESNKAFNLGEKKFSTMTELGDALKTSLDQNSVGSSKLLSNISIDVATSFKGKSDFAPTSILPESINSFTTQFKIDKASLTQRIKEVSDKAEANRNSYLKNDSSIKTNKL